MISAPQPEAVDAGADILMLFDSWSHMIPSNFFRKCAIDPTANIISMLKSKNVTKPIIGLPFKAGSSLIDYSYESNVNCIALDWTVNLNWAISRMREEFHAIDGDPEEDLLKLAIRIHDEDISANHEMGRLGAELIEPNSNVITCLLYTSPSPRDVEESGFAG